MRNIKKACRADDLARPGAVGESALEDGPCFLREGGQINPEILEKLGIRKAWMDRFPSELSGGELQRFCIARALGEGTKILLADEITTMLDMVTQSIIWHVLVEETGKRGIGMLIVSHSESPHRQSLYKKKSDWIR